MKSRYFPLLILFIIGICFAKDGMRVVLEGAPTKEFPQITRKICTSLMEKIRNRLGALGIRDARVKMNDKNQIIVEIPHKVNEKEVLSMLKPTSLLEFRYLKDVKTEKNPKAPYDLEIFSSPQGGEKIVFYDRKGKEVPVATVLKDSPVILTSKDLDPKGGARVEKGPFGLPQIVFHLNNQGQKKFYQFTKSHIEEFLAIVLGGRIISAPRIKAPIPTQGVSIEGGFKDMEEAQKFADLINAGTYPVPVKIISFTNRL